MTERRRSDLKISLTPGFSPVQLHRKSETVSTVFILQKKAVEINTRLKRQAIRSGRTEPGRQQQCNRGSQGAEKRANADPRDRNVLRC